MSMDKFKNVNIYFAKIRPSAIIPSKRTEDAGYDIYANFDDDFIIIEPHMTTIIPTGIASSCPSEYCFVLKERSSTGSKGIAQRCGIIDSGYRGEWGVPITNTTNKRLVIAKKSVLDMFADRDFLIYPYEKAITQALVVPVPNTISTEITYEELKNISSERDVGAFGSSNK